MPGKVRTAVAAAVTAVALGVLAAAPAPAAADRACGTVGRPYTDARAEVVVRKGRIRCATARGLMRRYWRSRVEAFRSVVRLRHAGIHWRCRPVGAAEFPSRWRCDGGGPDRDRFHVTARE